MTPGERLHEAVARHARERPGGRALVDRRGLVTWAELWSMSLGLAAHLRSLGVVPRGRVTTALPPDGDFAAALVAASRLGAALVPLDPRSRDDDLAATAGRLAIEAAISVAQHEGYPLAAAIREAAGLPPDRVLIPEGAGLWASRFPRHGAGRPSARRGRCADLGPHRRIDGTTGGRHALATRRRRGLSGRVQGDPRPSRPAGRDAHALGAVHEPCRRGRRGRGGLVDRGTDARMPAWSPGAVLRAHAEHRIPVLAGVPAMLAILLEALRERPSVLSHTEVVVCLGDRLPGALAERVRAKICPCLLISYGMTEANVLTLTEPDVPAVRLDEGHVGRLLPGGRMRASPEGELEVLALQVIEGDLEAEEMRAAFTRDGWFRTGDLGRVESDGGVWVTGRLKQFIRVGSCTVLPHEVEAAALAHPEVAACAAVGRPDPTLGETVVLFAAPRGGKLTREGLARHLEARLADFKRPRAIVLEPDLPRTRADKIDRAALACRIEEMAP